MTHESEPSAAEYKNDMSFSSKLNRLFDVIDAQEKVAGQNMYFRVIWDEANPQVIDDVITMTMQPTGALRQEYRNKFSRAQFKMTEMSETTGSVDQNFIWCYTGPRVAGSDVEPDTQVLREEYNFSELTENNIIRTLKDKAEQADDYLELLRVMEYRDIASYPGLTRQANNQAYKIINNGLVPPDIKLGDINRRETLFGIMKFLDKVTPQTTKSVQGILLGRLMSAIPLQWGKQDFELEPEVAKRTQAAIATIEEALANGVLPLEYRLTDRIVRNPALYRYNFTTELLSQQLKGPGYTPYSRQAFGVERTSFAHNFILGTIDRRIRNNQPEDNDGLTYAKALIRLTKPLIHVKNQVSFDDVASLAKFLSSGGIHTTPNLSVDESFAAGPASAAQNFRKILLILRSSNPETVDEEALDDDKCIEIVETILWPVIAGHVGNRVLLQEIESTRWEDQ